MFGYTGWPPKSKPQSSLNRIKNRQ